MSIFLSINEFNFYKIKFIFFKNKFSFIGKIVLNDKIGIINNEIYLDKYCWNRYIKRRFNNQSHIKVNIYLKKEFNLFVKFLDQYLEIVRLLEKKSLLTNKLYHFINKIINGLYNLKNSYPEQNGIVKSIDSIILTINEFNEKIEEYLLIKIRKNSI